MRTLLILSAVALGAYLIHRKLGAQIMATRSEVLASLSNIATVLDKVSGETSQLLADIAALCEQVENGDIPGEIAEAVRNLETRAKAIDDLVTDTPSPTAGPDPTDPV